MKTKYFISFIIISLALIGSFNLVNKAFAQETTGIEDIQYPIKELGDCGDELACKSYCDESKNMEVCIDFAEKNKLMSEEEIQTAKNFMAAGNEGPGGCRGKDECNAYCNNVANIDECVTFAEDNNLMPPKELEEAKKVQAAIKRGVKPPSCGNKKQCDVYCEDSDHMEECITFGAEAGFIQGKELEDAQKMLAALKRGIKPPPCKGKEACDEYCSNPDNMEMCMTFALEAGFMSEEEKANSQKMLEALKKGVKPPNCRGKDECDVYCSREDHFEECTNFAEAAGFMTSEEAAMARKTGGKGPGDCKNREECDAFCNNPDNQETCFNFAKENGMISEEDLKQMEEGKQRFKETLDQASPSVIECLNFQIGPDLVEKFKSGVAMPPKDIGDKMRTCFEAAMGPSGPGEQGEPGAGGMIPPAGQTGPGGCKTAEECQNYCSSNSQECQNFQQPPSEPGIPIGPGGGDFQQAPPTCTSPEQCQQMQNQIINPGVCQGENCQYGPPPSGQQPPIQQQPPADQNIFMPPQPSVEQQPPDQNSPPPPSSLIGPNSLLGSVIQSFIRLFNR
jgi:hypothetical protein